jgi:hypothetical protein
MAADAEGTALATISLLEARLLRIEHHLYGTTSASPRQSSQSSAVESLADLERRFSSLLSRFKVYADLLNICTPSKYANLDGKLTSALDKTHPSLFQSPSPAELPTQLDTAALRATVLAAAAAYPAAASALTAATTDSPVPDPSLSAALAALAPRMERIEVLQREQEAEMAALRARGEAVIRRWYEGRALRYSRFVADVEGRVEGVEKAVRRAERRRDDEAQG